MNNQTTSSENSGTWIKNLRTWIENSVTLKLITIGILMLLMLIPATMIENIIYHRKMLSGQTYAEVSSGWAREQEINGPVLTIPVICEEIIKKDNEVQKVQKTHYYHLLPEMLNINGELVPEELKRAIYKVIAYRSTLGISGKFNVHQTSIEQKSVGTTIKEIKYDQAFLTIGISDLKGINDQIALRWNNQNIGAKPGSLLPSIIPSGVTIELPNLEPLMDSVVDFDFTLALQGTRNMSFVPLGNTTKVSLNSDWDSPKFNGNFLPDFREVTESGFSAKWEILQINRNIAQSWIGMNQSENMRNATFGVELDMGDINRNIPEERLGMNRSENMKNAAFGVDLILPVDNYRKSIRSVEYAWMIIGLTFLIFFLVGMLNKRKMHPFQYILVGVALCLFYVLLISISEQSDFNFAYGISTLAIITMISLYSISIFKAQKLTALLAISLSAVYGFLFTLLQIADYALLIGSLGLTIILGLTMYFTRNINWYKVNSSTE